MKAIRIVSQDPALSLIAGLITEQANLVWHTRIQAETIFDPTFRMSRVRLNRF